MFRANLVSLLLFAPVPEPPGPYDHPVTGKKIANIPEVVVGCSAEAKYGFGACFETICLHQHIDGVKGVSAACEKEGKDLSPDALQALVKKYEIPFNYKKQQPLEAIEKACENKHIACVCLWEFNPTTRDRDLYRACLLYVDPDTVKERYVCILDPRDPKKPKWIKYKEFLEGHLRWSPKGRTVDWAFFLD